MLQGVTATLGIAVVHYRTPEVALDCLTRLRVAAPGARIVVVDTAPDPAFEQRLAAEHPEVQFLKAPNHSYSRSVNLGVAALGTELVALMNADVLVEPDTFTKLTSALSRNGGRAVVAPLALTPSGAPQNMGWPYARYYRLLRSAAAKARARAPEQQPAAPASVEVAWLAGYLQLMHADVWQRVGGYDESFRFFNEDIDFCLRVRESGYACRLVDAEVVHLGGTSTPTHPAFHVEGRRGGMVVSRRHHGPVYRWAHAAYLWAEAQLGRRLARSEQRRDAHEMVLELLRTGAWHRSPFGATLDERRSSVREPAFEHPC